MFEGAVQIHSPSETPAPIIAQPTVVQTDHGLGWPPSVLDLTDDYLMNEPAEVPSPEVVPSTMAPPPQSTQRRISPLPTRKPLRNRRKAAIRPISTPQLRLASVSSQGDDDDGPSAPDSSDATSNHSPRRPTPPRAAKRPITYTELDDEEDGGQRIIDDEEFVQGSSADNVDAVPKPARTKRQRPSKTALSLGIVTDIDAKGKKRWHCPEPNCSRSFSRLNDTIRHLKQAFAHAQGVAESTTCSKCGASLSRADARKRHEAKGACGKRSLRKNAIQRVSMQVPRA